MGIALLVSPDDGTDITSGLRSSISEAAEFGCTLENVEGVSVTILDTAEEVVILLSSAKPDRAGLIRLSGTILGVLGTKGLFDVSITTDTSELEDLANKIGSKRVESSEEMARKLQNDAQSAVSFSDRWYE